MHAGAKRRAVVASAVPATARKGLSRIMDVRSAPRHPYAKRPPPRRGLVTADPERRIRDGEIYRATNTLRNRPRVRLSSSFVNLSRPNYLDAGEASRNPVLENVRGIVTPRNSGERKLTFSFGPRCATWGSLNGTR